MSQTLLVKTLTSEEYERAKAAVIQVFDFPYLYRLHAFQIEGRFQLEAVHKVNPAYWFRTISRERDDLMAVWAAIHIIFDDMIPQIGLSEELTRAPIQASELSEMMALNKGTGKSKDPTADAICMQIAIVDEEYRRVFHPENDRE